MVCQEVQVAVASGTRLTECVSDLLPDVYLFQVGECLF